MSYIWFLDCGSASVTKVKLSEAMDKELDDWLNNLDGDVSDWLSHYEEELGVNINSSSWMITNDDTIHEVDL